MSQQHTPWLQRQQSGALFQTPIKLTLPEDGEAPLPIKTTKETLRNAFLLLEKKCGNTPLLAQPHSYESPASIIGGPLLNAKETIQGHSGRPDRHDLVQSAAQNFENDLADAVNQHQATLCRALQTRFIESLTEIQAHYQEIFRKHRSGTTKFSRDTHRSQQRSRDPALTSHRRYIVKAVVSRNQRLCKQRCFDSLRYHWMSAKRVRQYALRWAARHRLSRNRSKMRMAFHRLQTYAYRRRIKRMGPQTIEN